MSGYSDNLHNDVARKAYDAYRHDAAANYQLYLGAHWTPGQSKPTGLASGSNPESYGPNRGIVTERESQLQGRGQHLSKAPECGVIYLSETTFPFGGGDDEAEAAANGTMCQHTDLEALHTRSRRSCGTLAEVDISNYTMHAKELQEGYMGVDPHMTGFEAQTRMLPEQHGCGPRGSYAGQPNFF